jgi:hypothetical protein
MAKRLNHVEMDEIRYEQDGKYAAEIDFKRSYNYLLDNVVRGFEALTEAIVMGTVVRDSTGIVGHDWSVEYLEEGLRLTGFEEASLLLRKDLAKCADVFAEGLMQKSRKQKLKKARGFGGAKGFGKKQRAGKRLPVVEEMIKKQLDRGGKIIFERNNEVSHISVVGFPNESGEQDIKMNILGDMNDPTFMEYVEEVRQGFPGTIESMKII